MKRALVFSLIFALGIGVAGFAGAFTGSWDTSLCLDWVDEDITFGDFFSTLYVDYSISGWVLGSNLVFDNTGLSQMWFDASGNFGAFAFTSIIEFAPADAFFVGWENIVEVSIAGVNFYGLFDLMTQDDGGDPAVLVPGDIGVGFAFGAVAQAGDIDLGAEIQFGAGGSLYFVWLYGVQGAYGYYDGWQPCAAYTPYTLSGNGSGADCDPGFTGFDLYVGFPFTCLDITVFAGFSCANGFDDVTVLLQNIDLGAGWFNIDSMAITFQTSGKSMCFDFDLTLGDAVCITPYLSIIDNSGAYVENTAWEIDGISLDALTLTYNYNGVTFKAGEIFNRNWERESGFLTAAFICAYDQGYNWYFSPTGAIQYRSACAFRVDEGEDVYTYPNEFFGISIDGDSCCGGGFNVDLYNFLYAGGDAGEFGIFGWVGSYAAVSIDVGTQFTMGANTTVSYNGMEELCFNFGFSW